MPDHSPLSIDILLGQSASGWRLTLVVHAIAGVAPLFSGGGWLTLLLWPLLALSLIHCRRTVTARTAASVSALRLFNDEWKLQLRNGTWIPCSLKGERLIIPFLTILRFQPVKKADVPWRRMSLVIFHDAVPKEPFRKLRVYLRLSAGL